jgi:hypothetical protein
MLRVFHAQPLSTGEPAITVRRDDTDLFTVPVSEAQRMVKDRTINEDVRELLARTV